MSGDEKFLVDARLKNPHAEGCLSNTRWVHESRFRVTEFTRDTHHRVCVEFLRIHEAAAAVRGRAIRRDYRPSLAEFPGPSMIVLGSDDSYTSLQDGHSLQALMPDCRL